MSAVLPSSSAPQDPVRSNASSSAEPTGPRARFVLRIDGLFEALIGVLLLTSPVTGLFDAIRLPSPAVEPVVVVAGLPLLPLLPVLWRASRTPKRQALVTLAAANGLSAIVFCLWVAVWHSAFSAAGAAFVLTVAGALAILAIVQGTLARTMT